MKMIPIPTQPLQHRSRVSNFAFGNGFSVRAQADEAEIRLYDEIGYWGVTAAAFRAELDAITAPRIRLAINSPGGEVFDGLAMFNDLVSHPADVTVDVNGIAASAASIVAMAGDNIRIASNAFIMVHNAMGLVWGNKADMIETAAVLDRIDGALAGTYVERTGLDLDDVVRMMDDETWLTAGEAVDNGFADEVIGDESDAGAEARALFDVSGFGNAPAKLKRSIEAGLRDAGLSRREAIAATATGIPKRSPQRDADDGFADLGASMFETLRLITSATADRRASNESGTAKRNDGGAG